MSRVFSARAISFGAGLGLLVAACGGSFPNQRPSASWNPGATQETIRSSGAWMHGRSEHLTLWHGIDPNLLRIRPEAILGDDRAAVLTATPHHIEVELGASEWDRQLKTAVRRIQARPSVPTLFEVFFQPQAGALRSLAQVLLDPAPQQLSETWASVQCAVPREAGTLTLVSRDPRPIGAQAPTTEVAWQSPVVLPVQRPNHATPDVLLVTIDTFRADALDFAPRLAAILAQGQLWPRAISPSNWTLPSYGSLFTGLPAAKHQAGRGPFAPEATGQIESRQLSAVDPQLTLLAERFRTAGYATGMVHQNPMLETWTGFPRGFEQYQRASDRTTDALQACEDFLATNTGRPRFFVLHLMAPHLPYRFGPDPDPLDDLPLATFLGADHTPEARDSFFSLPATARERVRQRYFAEVGHLDTELGPWLEKKMQSPTPLVIGFHSDHGEELWDSGSFEHGHSFDNSVIEVPVALIAPGQLAPALYEAAIPAELLGASLLNLVGIEHDLPHTLQQSPAQFRSSMPLYRAREQGRDFGRKGVTSIPFDPNQGSEGNGAPISEQKRRMLAELGYLADQEMRAQDRD
ncbi:MAG: sulfatase-like hydrolase/transferase [Planctomycetes bacterium]|nr:sulfatase-like hydrolase/transferase [Planctomycetota bacterium]